MAFRYILLYILLIVAVLPMFILRDYTLSNELRYMSIADEALRNGDIFTFTNHGIAYADKPPLYLWIVMLGKLLFGTHSMLFLGIFSFIPALVILYTMDKWVKKIVPENDRLNGQLNAHNQRILYRLCVGNANGHANVHVYRAVALHIF